MFKGIDLSSDTATKPTQAMRNAMMNAEVGDEQKGEDPTTNALQSLVAEKFGFSHAIFLPSATMANQIAIQCLSNPGDQLIAAYNAHIFQAENGGPAIHARVMCNPVFAPSGIFSADDVKRHCLSGKKNPKQAIAKLLSLENSFNFGGGTVWEKKELREILHCAKELNLKTHMDGARIFNASIKTGVSVKELCKGFDTVTICLSKGLGCPVGALLAFNEVNAEKIRYLKNLMGGAMRQSGILAAAGIYALNHHVERLAEDHKNAAVLAKQLSLIPGVNVINPTPETNIVLFEWTSDKLSMREFHKKCAEKNLRFSEMSDTSLRAVTHLDISNKDIMRASEIVKGIAEAH